MTARRPSTHAANRPVYGLLATGRSCLDTLWDARLVARPLCSRRRLVSYEALFAAGTLHPRPIDSAIAIASRAPARTARP